MNSIPILMYHAIEDACHPAGAKDPGEQLYVLQTKQFREQMEYLSLNNYHTYHLHELDEIDILSEKAVVLTFDDGHASNYSLALPILQQHGLKAHFFITTGWIGTPYYMSPGQIRSLQEAGMGIGSHGVTHRFLTDLREMDAEQELLASRESLTRILEQTVTSFSAPGGRLTRTAADIAREKGYRTICNSEAILFKKGMTVIPRIALTENCSMQTFVKIVGANTAYFRKQRIKHAMLSAAKKALGNDRYVAVRKILLK